MFKIFKYLKSSLASVLIIIGLLLLQAYLDLTLPDYTSKIVNVGIQQSGIENAALDKVGEETLNKLYLFMDADDIAYINKNYEKTESYNNEKIYKLKKNANKEKLNKIFRKPMTIVYYIDTAKDTNVDFSKMNFNIPEGMNMYEVLNVLDDNTKTEITKEINKKLKAIPDSIMDQTAVSYAKEEYKRIGINVSDMQTVYMIKTGAIMVLIALLVLADGILIVFIGSRMAARLAKTLRKKVFKKVVGFSKNEMKKFGSSSLITRTTNDIQQVQQVIVFLMRVVFYAPIIGIGGVIKAMNTNSSMTYIIGVAVITIILIVVVLFAIAMPKFSKMQILVDKLNLVTRERLSGLPVIRAFSNEKHEEDRFVEANKRLTKVNIFVNRAMSFMMPIMMLIMNVIALAIVYKGAHGVDDGIMQVGDIMAYIQYSMQIIMAFLMISMMSIMLPRANVSAKRINEVLETEELVKEPTNPMKTKEELKGVVEFKNVSFRYPDADYDVITDINLKANRGEVTAFIGSTGSGKSTVINLIPRFYDVTAGEILVEGVNVKNISLHDLRAKIGFVPQKGILFTGTISDNIKYGNDTITDQDVDKALKISQSEEFVSKLPNTKNYDISQGGSNVSGGQKQRLSIARAIAKDPNIYIFDDSFSALDFKTDAKLRKELSSITKNKTVLIVAQRISTIMNADKIVVLDEGNIVGIGTHEDLMKNCDIYREIALSQLSKEELENA